MKSWYLFLVSIGSLFVCLANLTEKPMSLIVLGVGCMICGGFLFMKERGKSRS